MPTHPPSISSKKSQTNAHSTETCSTHDDTAKSMNEQSTHPNDHSCAKLQQTRKSKKHQRRRRNAVDANQDHQHHQHHVHVMTSTIPSRVIHFRNVLPEITTDDLVQLCQPYGEVTHLLLLKNNQALVQYGELESAKQFIRTFGAKTIKPASNAPKVIIPAGKKSSALARSVSQSSAADVTLESGFVGDIIAQHVGVNAAKVAEEEEETGKLSSVVRPRSAKNTSYASIDSEGKEEAIIPLDNSILTSIHGGVSQAQIRDIKVYPNFSSHKELHKGAINDRGDSEKKNRILLATIFDSHPHTITMDMLYQKFVQCGPVDKIVMFNKAAGLQALVQFNELDDAVRARAELHNQTLYPLGATLSLQFSNLMELVVQHNDRSRDYNLEPYQSEALSDNNFMGALDQSTDSIETHFANLSNLSDTSGSHVDNSLFMQPESSSWYPDAEPPMEYPSDDSLTEKLVLLVSGFNDKEMDCTKLFNLFSCYGFVEKIKIFHSKPDHALIQFAEQAQALLAMTSLKGIEVFSRKLSINFSHHLHINTMSSGRNDTCMETAKQNDLMHDYTESSLNRFPRYPKGKIGHPAAVDSVIHPPEFGIAVQPSYMHTMGQEQPDGFSPYGHDQVQLHAYNNFNQDAYGMSSHPRVAVQITPETSPMSSPHRSSPGLNYSPLGESPNLFQHHYRQQQQQHYQPYLHSPQQFSQTPPFHGGFLQPMMPPMQEHPLHMPLFPHLPLPQIPYQPAIPKRQHSPTRFMCAPTTTVHVANIGGHNRNIKLKENDLRDMFCRFGSIETIQVYEHRKKPMALVKFKLLTDSVAAVCTTHNQTVKGQTLKLAFSRNRLVSSTLSK